MGSKGGRYNRRNVVQRLETTVRNEQRVREEHDENLTQMPFIRKVDVYVYEGDENTPNSEFMIHVVLKTPIIFKIFKKAILNKLRGAIIE